MRKIIDALKRIDTPLLWGIVCAVFGLAFILVPSSVLDWVLLAVGIPLLLMGVIRLIDSISAPRYSMVVYVISIVQSAFIVLLGLSLITSRTGVAVSVCSCLGAYIGFSSVLTIIRCTRASADRRDKVWYTEMTFAIILATFAFWISFFPTWPKQLAGVALLLVSAEFFLHVARPGRRSISDSARDVFEGSFTDRSDS